MTLKPLSFETISVMTAVGFAVVAFFLSSFRSGARRRGMAYLYLAVGFFIAGAAKEWFVFSDLSSLRLYSSLSAAAIVLGYALSLAGLKAATGIGAPAWLSIAVGAAFSLALSAHGVSIPALKGARTALFSLAFIAGGGAFLILDRRAWGGARLVRLLRWLVRGQIALSGLRFLGGIGDLRRDFFLPRDVNNVAFLLIGALGLSSYGLIIALIARQRRSPSPSGAGLRAKLDRLRTAGLSETELRYAAAALEGLSYARIAAEAGVAESTVRNTLAKAYKKCGVGDLKGLILYCNREQ
jgi:DNA-binding CsgD family transcriptional regulator